MKPNVQIDNHFENPLFIASVEDNNDPTFNYRVKVRIPFLHPESITTEQLPWAARLDSTFMGIGDEQDLNHAIPEIGTQVLVLAVGNDINSLIYLGCLYKKTAQTPSDNKYLDTYGIYRKDGQFIGVDKVQKLFQMLFDGDIDINKVGNITINAKSNVNITCNSANITAPTSTFNGNIECTGTVHASGTITSDVDCISAGISGVSHIHMVPQAPAGTLPSEPPQ